MKYPHLALTSPIFVRVDSHVKEEAEAILAKLGVSTSSAINMFLTQIVMYNGIPFDVRLPAKPIATGNMSDEEIKELVQEGIDSSKQKTQSPEEVDDYFETKYGVKR